MRCAPWPIGTTRVCGKRSPRAAFSRLPAARRSHRPMRSAELVWPTPASDRCDPDRLNQRIECDIARRRRRTLDDLLDLDPVVVAPAQRQQNASGAKASHCPTWAKSCGSRSCHRRSWRRSSTGGRRRSYSWMICWPGFRWNGRGSANSWQSATFYRPVRFVSGGVAPY